MIKHATIRAQQDTFFKRKTCFPLLVDLMYISGASEINELMLINLYIALPQRKCTFPMENKFFKDTQN